MVYYLSDLVGLALGLSPSRLGVEPAFCNGVGNVQDWRLYLLVRREYRAHRGRGRSGQAGRLPSPGVRCSMNYKYMCSDPGQSMVREKIVSEKLDGVVVASCSPHMHLKTFRKAAQAAGLNPYLVEMANIREHCSWVHQDRAEATAKAMDIIRPLGRESAQRHALAPIRVPVTRRALVIGGGVAGIQAALDIADAGYEVVMVEREPSIGGKMAGTVGDLPHARLLAVHPDSAHGRGGPASAHQAVQLFRSRSGRGLHRQFQDHDPSEGPLCRHRQVHRLRRVLDGLPAEEEPERIRLWRWECARRSTFRSRKRFRRAR